MAISSAINNEPVSSANAAILDMKFEIVVIPVSDVIVRRSSTEDLGGDSMPTSTAVRISG